MYLKKCYGVSELLMICDDLYDATMNRKIEENDVSTRDIVIV